MISLRLFIFACFAATVFTAVAAPVQICTEYEIPLDVKAAVGAVTAGNVTKGPPFWLLREPRDGCNDPRFCRTDSSAPARAGAPGIEIVRSGSWVCIATPGKRPLDVSVGWIPEARWKREDKPTTDGAWSGTWQNYNAKLRVRQSDDNEVSVTGNAIWRDRFGDFELKGISDGGILSTVNSTNEYECRIALKRISSFIYAADNGRCGAVNVRFSGLYRLRSNLY